MYSARLAAKSKTKRKAKQEKHRIHQKDEASSEHDDAFGSHAPSLRTNTGKRDPLQQTPNPKKLRQQTK
jgi:hypothetical protein